MKSTTHSGQKSENSSGSSSSLSSSETEESSDESQFGILEGENKPISSIISQTLNCPTLTTIKCNNPEISHSTYQTTYEIGLSLKRTLPIIE